MLILLQSHHVSLSPTTDKLMYARLSCYKRGATQNEPTSVNTFGYMFIFYAGENNSIFLIVRIYLHFFGRITSVVYIFTF